MLVILAIELHNSWKYILSSEEQGVVGTVLKWRASYPMLKPICVVVKEQGEKAVSDVQDFWRGSSSYQPLSKLIAATSRPPRGGSSTFTKPATDSTILTTQRYRAADSQYCWLSRRPRYVGWSSTNKAKPSRPLPSVTSPPPCLRSPISKPICRPSPFLCLVLHLSPVCRDIFDSDIIRRVRDRTAFEDHKG